MRMRTEHKSEIDKSALSSTLLSIFQGYANRHKNDAKADRVLMSFLRGECEHYFDEKTDMCELCGDIQKAYRIKP